MVFGLSESAPRSLSLGENNTYLLWEVRKAPDFVLEIGSGITLDADLWTTIESLPDGIHSALAAKTAGAVYGIEGSQAPLEIDGSQMPLISPSNLGTGPSPFDKPGPGETLVLLGAGDVKGCYAVSVDADGNPQSRPISPAQFISAAECAPNTPSQPLPQNTNKRVMAAFESFQSDLSRRLGRARRRRPDSRNRRYISRQLNISRSQAEPSEMADRPPQTHTELIHRWA